MGPPWRIDPTIHLTTELLYVIVPIPSPLDVISDECYVMNVFILFMYLGHCYFVEVCQHAFHAF